VTAVECVVFPRTDLDPEQCKALGEAINAWIYADPAYRFGESFGIDDLRKGGEFPQPFYLRRLMGIEGRTFPDEMRGQPGTPNMQTLSPEEREAFRVRLGAKAMSRQLDLTVLFAGVGDRARVVRSLRETIRAELVSEITVDGVSWDE
jgi:hypothetical protein